MNKPRGIREPEAGTHWLVALLKVLLWLCVIGVVLIVLAFGTCLLKGL